MSQMKRQENTTATLQGDNMMQFIETNDKTLAAILIAKGFKPISNNNSTFIFPNNKETFKICSETFDGTKFVITDTIFA